MLDLCFGPVAYRNPDKIKVYTSLLPPVTSKSSIMARWSSIESLCYSRFLCCCADVQSAFGLPGFTFLGRLLGLHVAIAPKFLLNPTP